MANQNQTQSVINPRSPIVGKNGEPHFQFLKTLQDWQTRINAGLGQLGELIGTFNGLIASSAKIQGRTEGIGTTVSNIDVAGIVTANGVDLSRPYVNKNFQHINGRVSTLQQVVNSPTNSTNYCTVDSIDNGTSATIQVYGAATGVGTTWLHQVGTTFQGPYPALSQAGLAYVTDYYVMFDPLTNIFSVSTSFADSLNDDLIFCGKITTVAAGGGGGTTGGGGTSGGAGGCVEIGTPVIEPEGTIAEVEANSEWVGLQFPGHSPVNMHPDTMVCVWKKARDLQAGDCISVGQKGHWRTDWSKRHFYRNSQKVKRTCPNGRYLAGTAQIELHNMKQA
jgi:hypothetical protein